MNEPERTKDIVGRANNDGATLFHEWFDGLTAIAKRGEQAANVFGMGSKSELLRVFDLPVVFPEINSLQTAVRRVAHEYLNRPGTGYSPDICGYVKADVAVQLRGGEHPMGRIPRPSIGVDQRVQHLHQVGRDMGTHVSRAVFTLDIPGTRSAGAQTWPGDRLLKTTALTSLLKSRS
jgi:benzoyl-CoA reductase subunit B